MRFPRVWALGVLLSALTSLTWSQTGTSTIRGTITDPQGRVVSGATVTLTNTATNASRTTKSTDAGIYVFDLIQPGTYRVDIEAKGFKKQTIARLDALIGKPTDGSTQLEVGTTAEVVEVTASSQGVLVNTQDASLGNNFVNQQITQLPLEARNFIDLLSLQPGATREGYVTGARADQSNVTLDGVDINNAQTGNADIPQSTNNLTLGQVNGDRNNITTGPVLRLNAEAIEEFRVTTASGNANQGRSSGSQVNLVTKSGTNSLHGAAFELYRSRGFTSNNWFNNHSSPPVPREPLQRNTFGGGIGGPIVKNRVFFFYSYEGRRDASGQSVVQVVPLASLGQGNIRYVYCKDPSCSSTDIATLQASDVQAAYVAPDSQNNPGPGLNPLAVQALADAAAKYPANDTTVGDQLNTGGFRFNAATPTKLNSHVAKIDFNLTSSQVAFLRANVIYDHQTLARWLPDTTSPTVWNHPWGIAAGHTWTIGNRWVNNFRYGLTRQAFTQGGDSFGNDISFRFVFQPTGQAHPVSRVTPVHNFTDDVSYIRGNHNLQFGVNIRKINNSRISFANAYDNAITNPSFYAGAGDHVSNTFQAYLDANGLPGDENAGQSLNSVAEVQNAATALIGRFSEFTADYTFAKNGNLLASGLPTNRDFATQAYDTYAQDTWKARRNLTLTLGLRYSLERPVYETQGFEVQPTIPLGTYFANRLKAAANGTNYIEPIVINRSGPANGGKPMYNWNKLNFQPRLAFAWSLDSASKSVLRGGFALTNDYYGEALAVDWDLNNTLGFTSNYTTPANTYDTIGGSANWAPLFTSYTQDIRGLAPPQGNIQFPLFQPSDYGERIEQSVDSTLKAPREYVWNLTFERQLPANSVFTLSYIGRSARRLLARRDVVAFNNLRDPKSGMTWYQAGTMLEKQRQLGTDTSAIAPIPFFENVLPPNFVNIVNDPSFLNGGFDPTWTNTQTFYAFNSRTPSNPVAFFSGNDWTDTQALVDQTLNFFGFPTLFMQPQYGALSAWSTVGNSNYNALALSLRTRLSSLTMDFNYTWSHSLDDASGLQTESGYGNNQANGAFIVNPIRQGDNYANSDFDIHHVINANAVWQMPFGKGRALLSNAPSVVDAILGGWQLAGIFRWNSGLPVTSPFDDARWATNWNVQAYVTPLHPISTCPSRPTHSPDAPKLFGNCDITAIYQNFRNAYPGETGIRNYLRAPGYIDLDLGLSKTWKMPYREGHELQLRWDVFNVTNTQHFATVDDTRTGFGVGRDPALRHLNPPADWSNFNGLIQGDKRVMQVGARYSF
jgi:hypothetical protein